MAKVITLADIAGMKDKRQINLQKGTIVTPSARDWASEHGICIVMEEDDWESKCSGQEQARVKLLDDLVENVVMQTRNRGISLKKDELYFVIRSCLEKMNCIVE